jgi:hypothetical protein
VVLHRNIARVASTDVSINVYGVWSPSLSIGIVAFVTNHVLTGEYQTKPSNRAKKDDSGQEIIYILMVFCFIDTDGQPENAFQVDPSPHPLSRHNYAFEQPAKVR